MSDEILELDYNLAELPSSQHRAGLAGLVLMVRWLGRDKGREGVCELTRLDENGTTLRIDQTGLRELFDETYAASKEEQVRDKIIKNPKTKKEVAPKRCETRIVTDPKTGKSKERDFYIYDVVIPKGAFLKDYDPTLNGDNGFWVKLWRDMVWNILRIKPTTRTPYNKRSEGRYTKDADEMWENLLQRSNSIAKLSGSAFVGIQASNAENVPFKDRIRFQFLLHFWSFVSQIYVPAVVTYDRKEKRDKTKFIPFALAIPDVESLESFCEELGSILRHDRGVDVAGYVPRESVIDLAAESALDLMHKLKHRLSLAAGGHSTRDLVLGIDVVHIKREKDNTEILSVARIDPTQRMIDEYARVRGMFRCALFRRQRLLNVLNEFEWFDGFGSLFSTCATEQTIKSRFFCADVRTAFKDFMQSDESTIGEQNEMDTDVSVQSANQSSVEGLVYQLISTYVRAKLRSKHELEWKEGFKGTQAEQNYNDKKAKIARDAFLSVRSRTGDDFVEYFASTLCSVPQFLSEDGYATIAQALHTDTDKVRTLTLLALSARG
jgi:CRISPR-associated protein Cmx8